MMTTIEKLAELREKMKGTGVDAYVITTDDFHASEYVGAYFREREYMFRGLQDLPEHWLCSLIRRHCLQMGGISFRRKHSLQAVRSN